MAETLKLMVTDDEPGMRTAVARALKDFSVRVPELDEEVRFEVAQAATGEQALEEIASAPPQILLLDHKLPGMSGLEVLEKLRGREDLLTIMITAYASLETAVTATKRGAFDFLAKPFTPEELKAAVRKAAGSILLSRHARRLNQEKRQVRFQFIRVLAHELQSPIAAVEGYLRLISDGSVSDPESARHMIDRCLVRTEQMRKLVGDLLDLTRIESGIKKREMTAVDLREAVAAAVETIRPSAGERGISVSVHADAPAPMRADREELDMIINNLLSNAVKYNRDGGRVDIYASVAGGVATIRVSDTGIGMTPEETQKIFQDFSRIRNEKTRNIFGSGLGLSTVRKLAQMYGGDATVESRAGEGSVFTVTLKTEATPPPAESPATGI